ncbi:MAG: hypothetical protein O2782_23055 [bacterium]|nr:hypothetical protein [bacterium]
MSPPRPTSSLTSEMALIGGTLIGRDPGAWVRDHKGQTMAAFEPEAIGTVDREMFRANFDAIASGTMKVNRE